MGVRGLPEPLHDSPLLRRPEVPVSQNRSFLHYYGPEDAALFFGRDQEIRQLQRQFHSARLLILHGESGTGKTSLICAGLLPRLSPESDVLVDVRLCRSPRRPSRKPWCTSSGSTAATWSNRWRPFSGDAETAHLKKTVVLILDQFEGVFLLRLPLEVRQRFHQELAACLTASAPGCAHPHDTAGRGTLPTWRSSRTPFPTFLPP